VKVSIDRFKRPALEIKEQMLALCGTSKNALPGVAGVPVAYMRAAEGIPDAQVLDDSEIWDDNSLIG
jgi:hypothetical protein